MAYSDKSFWEQSPQTKEDFLAVYGGGSDWGAAESAWRAENERNRVSAQSGSGSATGKGDSGGFDWETFFTNQAGESEAARKQAEKQFKAQLELSKAGLKENKRQFNLTLDQKKAELKQQVKYWSGQLKNERNRIEIERGRAAADAWYQEQQVNLALLSHQMEMSRLGLDYVKTAVEYASTPDNYWKLLDFQYGASQRQDVPLALQALQGNINNPAWQQINGSPESKSPDQLLSILGYGGGAQVGQPLPSQTATAATTGQAAGVAMPAGVNQAQGVSGAGTTSLTGATVPAGMASAQQAVADTMGDAGTTGGRGQGSATEPVDPRVAAIQGIVSAAPPSSTPGYNFQDSNALSTIMQLYNSPQSIAPGQWDAMPLDAKKLVLSGIQRGGGSANLFQSALAKTRINQGAAAAA